MSATRTLQDPRNTFPGPIASTSVEGPDGFLFLVQDAQDVRLTELMTFGQLRAWMRTFGLTF